MRCWPVAISACYQGKHPPAKYMGFHLVILAHHLHRDECQHLEPTFMACDDGGAHFGAFCNPVARAARFLVEVLWTKESVLYIK